MSLFPLFRWFDATPLGQIIRNSTYIFLVVEVFHLLDLTLLLGTVTVVDMRILGFGRGGNPFPVWPAPSHLGRWAPRF